MAWTIQTVLKTQFDELTTYLETTPEEEKTLMIPPAFDGTTKLTVRRTFVATRERVFRAWTEREALLQWFKPGGMGVTISKLDVQVGGAFCFNIVNGNHSLVGTYLEIVRPEKLVFTWSSSATSDKETVVTVDFIEHGLMTQVVLTHERLSSKEMYSLHQDGWQALLAQLDSVLSPPPSHITRFR